MARVYALANQKGGVGKTTTAVSLGASLASRGRRVLLVDVDPQANATTSLGLDGSLADASIYDVLIGELPVAAAIAASGRPNLDVLPSAPALAGAEVELVSLLAREHRLRRAIEPLLPAYDYVIIDCPPSLGLLTINALVAAAAVIVPVQCEYLALEGLGQLTEVIALVRRHLNPSLQLRGVVLTMFDARTNLSREVEAEVRRHFPATFAAVIPRSIRLSEAPSHGKTILEYDAASRGARAYLALADELLGENNA